VAAEKAAVFVQDLVNEALVSGTIAPNKS